MKPTNTESIQRTQTMCILYILQSGPHTFEQIATKMGREVTDVSGILLKMLVSGVVRFMPLSKAMRLRYAKGEKALKKALTRMAKDGKAVSLKGYLDVVPVPLKLTPAGRALAAA